MNIIEFMPMQNYTEYSNEEFKQGYKDVVKDNHKWDNKAVNNSNVRFNTEDHCYGSIYFDGELEREMGFDIAMHTGGIIDQDFKVGDTFKAEVIHPVTLKRIESIGLIGEYERGEVAKHYVLIMTLEDYSYFINTSDLTAECGGVTFKKETT